MVKGITKRVIVVKPENGDLFDEAIFIIREDASAGGITSADILKEARSSVNDYMRKNDITCKKHSFDFRKLLPFLLGAFSVSAVWLISFFI